MTQGEFKNGSRRPTDETVGWAGFSKFKAQSSKLKTSSNPQVSELQESWKDRDLELGVWNFRQAAIPATEFAQRPLAKHQPNACFSLPVNLPISRPSLPRRLRILRNRAFPLL